MYKAIKYALPVITGITFLIQQSHTYGVLIAIAS